MTAHTPIMPLHELAYELRLDAPALVTTLAGDPNTVSGETFLPGGSLLGAFAGHWIDLRHLGPHAHQDANFARLFLRGGLTFLNALPEDPEQPHGRLLPAPLSILRPKGDSGRAFDLCAEQAEEAERRLSGFCSVGDGTIRTHEPKKRLRLHTARADRLIGRPTETEGALFAYEALEGGQTFVGSVLGGADDLRLLVETLGWRDEALTLSLGRSRSAEYGGQARLRLLPGSPRPFAGEATQRQQPERGLVLTLTAALLCGPDNVHPGSGQLAFPFTALAAALSDAGLAVTAEQLQGQCRVFTRPVVAGGYSGVWGMPRPQLAGFAAGSVFHFWGLGTGNDARLLRRIEQRALGSRTAEGYGRFVLNWHGETGEYRLKSAERAGRPVPPAAPVPSTFCHLTLDVARSWAAETVRAEARLAASAAQRDSRLPSPALLRRLSDLLREITPENAPGLRARLGDLRAAARQQIERCTLSGAPLRDQLLLLCSADMDAKRPALRGLLRLQDLPVSLGQVLRQAGQRDALESPEQLARLATLYVQVVCAEMARLQRGRREGGVA